MERCTEHDLINCKCRESLATFLVKQFAESNADGVVRSRTWNHIGGSGDHDRGRDRDRGFRRGDEAGGDR